MSKILIVMALNGLGLFSTAHEGKRYDSGSPTVTYKTDGGKKAWNWWDHRPARHLFEVDEGGQFVADGPRGISIVEKGGL